jgi:hypothetical protein
MRPGEVWATRNDGAVLIYDRDDEYGRALGHIKTKTKTYSQRPVMALMVRGGWTVKPIPITAAGDSWRWQLRDAEGRWIEMGSEVKWLAKGRWKFGIVVGSPAPGVATVEEALTAIRRDIPSARLEVVRDAADLINRVYAARDEKGHVDWRSLALDAPMAVAEAEPLPEIPKIPEEIFAEDLKPGDVYVRDHDKTRIRVTSVDLSDEGYVNANGIILSGPTAGTEGTWTMQTIKRGVLLRYEGNQEPQDFDRDVLAPVKIKLDALKAKYSDGMAAAIAAALTPPLTTESEPQMSNRLKELGRDVEVVRWMYAEAAARDRLRELRDEGSERYLDADYWDEHLAASETMRALHYNEIGGKIREYNILLLNHQAEHKAWSDRVSAASDVITPHSDAAKEILAEVREIGHMVRLGITVDLAQRADPEGDRERAALTEQITDLQRQEDELVIQRGRAIFGTPRYDELVRLADAKHMEVRAAMKRRLSLPNPGIDPEYVNDQFTIEQAVARTAWKRRRELARRAVAVLVGNATETKQTWVPEQPKRWGYDYLRPLTSEEQAAMTEMLLNYPASWVERFDEGTLMTTSMGDRGGHRDEDHHIMLSARDGLGLSDEGNDIFTTIAHEEGHRMQTVVLGLSGLEAMFWHDRLGEASEKVLHKDDNAQFPVPNTAQNPNNLAKPTAQRYTLKVYGNVYSSKQVHWEVFTTGVQEVLGGGQTEYTVRRLADHDLWEFTMGALLTLDGRKGNG